MGGYNHIVYQMDGQPLGVLFTEMYKIWFPMGNGGL